MYQIDFFGYLCKLRPVGRAKFGQARLQTSKGDYQKLSDGRRLDSVQWTLAPPNKQPNAASSESVSL